MTTTAPDQAAFLRERLHDFDEIRRDIRAVVADLSPDEMRRRPADGGWSIAEVLAHLVASDSDYVPKIRALLDRAHTVGPRADGRPWRASFFGKFLVRSLDPSNTRKMPAPKRWRPAAGARPAAEASDYLRVLDEVAELARKAEGLDLGGIKLASPVSPLIRMNLGDGFLLLATHARRHLGQMRRVRAEVARR